MGTVAPINVVELGALIFGAAMVRMVGTRLFNRYAVAPKADLEAVQMALAADGGQIIRARREVPGVSRRSEYEGSGRLYHVTVRIGSVSVRRRVVVRDGAPAILLP
jgi:hypothetical protein